MERDLFRECFAEIPAEHQPFAAMLGMVVVDTCRKRGIPFPESVKIAEAIARSMRFSMEEQDRCANPIS